MIHSSTRTYSKKHIIALGIALIAIIAWGIQALQPSLAATQEPLSLIPLALAKDTRALGPLSMFLKADGIPGDSDDQKHRGEIVVDSYALQFTRAGLTGKAAAPTLILTMPSGKALPKLFLNAAGGVKVARAVLSVRSGNSAQDFIRWTLTDTTIVSVRTIGNTHGDGVEDQVEIAFGKIEVEVTPLDGSTPIKSGWDLRMGKSI